MTAAAPEGFQVSGDDLHLYDWKARIPEKRSDHWLITAAPFATAAKEYQESGDDLGRRVYSLLHAVTSFYPNYDAKGNPYGPAWSAPDGSRSITADDLSDGDLAALASIVDETPEPDLRARIADVLWECQRNYKAAEVAVRAYLEAAELVKKADLWPPYVERVQRAAQLAARLGFRKPLHEEVRAVIESAISAFEHDFDSGLLCHRLMLIALSHEAGDPIRYARLSEDFAAGFAERKNFDFSHWYWQLAEQWHYRAKNKVDAQRCQVAAAESLVSKAQDPDDVAKLGLAYAAHWMGAGVQALRQAKGEPARIQQLHRRFLELQRESLTQLNPLELNVDQIPGFRHAEEQVRAAVIAHVSGYSLERAITRFVHITKPSDPAALFEQLEEQSELTVFDKIVPSAALDHSGKVADTMAPTGFGPTDPRDEAVRKRLVQQARQIGWPLQTAWRIEPGRLAIIKEHALRQRDLIFLVANNPFIPEGHEGIYLRGLHAGFFGDWLVAMHLLVPQIEASVRHVLQQHDVITSTLESDGTQKERDLNQLFWMPEFEEIFGADVAFDLRGILIERFGDNMRNESAHGLMPEGAFYQPTAPYLWWLVLYLCFTGFMKVREVERNLLG